MNTISSLSVASILRNASASETLILEFASHFEKENSHFNKSAFIADAKSKGFRRFSHTSGYFASRLEKFIERRPDGWFLLDETGRVLRKSYMYFPNEMVDLFLKEGQWVEV